MKKIFFSLLFVFSVALSFAQAPVLGNYPNTAVAVGSNSTVMPSAVPSGTSTATAYTSPSFKGVLQMNPATGIVTVTNANPAGTYSITVKAVYSNASTTKTFTLQVGSPTCSEGLFAGTQNLSGVTSEYVVPAVVAGDFNNDGRADFAAADMGSNRVTVRLGNSTGGFTAAANVGTGTSPNALAIADFNNDGNQDIAAVNQGSNTVTIRLGDGTGSFTGTTQIATGSSPRKLAVADFNGDGNPDIAVTNYSSNTVSVLLGDGTGNFSLSVNIPVGQGPQSVVTADLNNDGWKDLLAGNYRSNKVVVCLGNGSGGFAITDSITVGSYSDLLVTGDFNKDGNTDFAGYVSVGSITIRYGNGTGAFPTASSLSITGLTGLAATDLNNDGNPDLVATTGGYVWKYLGNGAGGFTGSSTALGLTNATLTVTDLNNDGIQDLIIPTYNTQASPTYNYTTLYYGGASQISLFGNNTLIASGSNSPSAADSTDFGSTDTTGSRTFTIRNTGTTDLYVGNILLTGPEAAAFSVQGIGGSTTVPANASVTFRVLFAPITTGVKNAVVTVNSANCQNRTYAFAIRGTGLASAIALSYPTPGATIAGKNTAVLPAQPPARATSFTATTSANFKGLLRVDPLTGAVIITNAQPAGTYTITVRAYTFSTCFLLTVNNPVCSQGRFAGTNDVYANTYPYAVAVGDFNGDGKQDLIAPNNNNQAATVLLGTGSGTFTTSNAYIWARLFPDKIAVNDFNADGKQDIVITNPPTNTVSIRLGDGIGNFTGFSSIGVGGGPRGIVAVDFNNDGKADIATANYDSSSVSVRLGDGLGGFAGTTELVVNSFPRDIWVADFNNDGNIDMAIPNAGTANAVSIRLGNGAGGFIAAPDLPVASASYAAAGGDFNNDGNADLAVAVYGANTITVFAGNGTGSFSLMANVPVGGSPNYVATGDFNGDNKADFVVANANGIPLSVWLGNGAGGFTAGQIVASAAGPLMVAVGDFNGDSRLDLASVNPTFSNISIRLGTYNEINVLGNNATIVVGNNVPDTTHHTSFGNITVGNTLTRTFTIQNTGIDTLRISDVKITGTDSLLFTTGGLVLPAIVLAGASKTFTVTFTPTGGGVKTAKVNILNNDCDESVYDFAIRGGAVCASVTSGNVWLGNSTDWNLPSNWLLGSVPNACTRVVVNAGVPFMPQISTNAVCYSLTLNNGATFTATDTGSLNITGP